MTERTEKFHVGLILVGLLVLGALAVSYFSVIQALVQQWLRNEDYSHGILIVPIVIYLAWRKREMLRNVPISPDWRALPFLIVPVAVFIVGELGAELFTTRVSLLLFVIGLVWLLYGLPVVKVFRFPLAFLFLMLPLPGFIYRNVTFPLQLAASMGSVKILQLLGVSVFREGNVIDLGFTQFQVVEACSGLRYVLPLLTLGVLFAYLGQRSWWKRIVMVVATVPIAVAANILRVAGTGLVGLYWGSKAAEGFFHGFSGWLVFMVSVGFFAILNWVLLRLPGKKGGPPSTHPQNSESGVSMPRRAGWAAAATSAVLILFTPVAVSYLGAVPPQPLKRPLTAFPTEFQGMKGTQGDMAPEIWERVGGQNYVIINYEAPPSNLNFYVAYYEYQRKAGDFIHSPRLCLPGAGWFIEHNRVREIAREQGETLKLNELFIQKSGMRQLVYFWYQGRDRNFTSEWAAKFYMVWDGIWRRRTDGALVRVIMPVQGERSVQEVRAFMDDFAAAASIELENYLP